MLEKDGEDQCKKWSVVKQRNIVRGIPENNDTARNETWKPKYRSQFSV